jgi:cytochrome c-type biogenesis protein
MEDLPQIGLLLAFGAGLISFFSPCVAPLVPGYLSFISGISTSGRTGGGGAAAATLARPRVEMQTVVASLVFVLGFTLVFVFLGAGAALFGGLLEAYRQPLTRITGVVMIGMGLLLADVLRLPALDREWRIRPNLHALGPSAPLLLGMTFAFGWVPCIGPILAGILLYAGSTATVGTGVWLLFAYSLGLGVPFVISGVAASWTLGAARRLRRFWPWITRLSGLLLVLIGILFVTGRFFYLSIFMQRLTYALFY